MQINKPSHRKYLLRDLDEVSYSELAIKYSKAKRYGYRASVAVLTGSGYKDVAIELSKGTLRKWGREGLAFLGTSVLTWAGTPFLPLITNSTKIVKTATAVHTGISYAGQCLENSGNVGFLLPDMIFFGQPIPIGENGRFNIMSNITDIFNY